MNKKKVVKEVFLVICVLVFAGTVIVHSINRHYKGVELIGTTVYKFEYNKKVLGLFPEYPEIEYIERDNLAKKVQAKEENGVFFVKDSLSQKYRNADSSETENKKKIKELANNK